MDSNARRRLDERLDQIVRDPFDPRFSKPLTGIGGARSSRVGGLRIIYFVRQAELLVLVQEIGARGQVYRKLR